MGTAYRFSHNISNPTRKALSEMGVIAWWWKLSKIVSELKASSFDFVVYEVTDSEILSAISVSVLVAGRVIKPDFSKP